MTTTLDTSNGLIVLLGGAVQLPTSGTSVSSPPTGSLRYNSTTDTVEWYGGSGSTAGWYEITDVYYSGIETIGSSSTLTSSALGKFIICSSGSTITITLPAISTVRALTGFTFYAAQAPVTIITSGGNTIGSGSSYTIPIGTHLTLFNDGSSNWYGKEFYNAVATITPFVFESVSGNITATGTNQSTAVLLASKYNVVWSVGTGTGVRLPSFVNYGIGVELVILNNDPSNNLLIYPQSGAQIDSLGANNPYSLAPGSQVRYILISATHWLSFSGIDASTLLDNDIGNTQGDVLYRSAVGWEALAPGTTGQFFRTQGAAANPHWAALSSGDVTTALGYTPSAINSRTSDTVFWGTNSSSSASRLTTNGSTAGAGNVGALIPNSAQLFDIELLAFDVTSNAAVTFTLIGGLIGQGANAAATIISGSPSFTVGTATSGAPTISTIPTVAADTTYGGFNIQFTPPISNTDTWHISARVRVTIAS